MNTKLLNLLSIMSVTSGQMEVQSSDKLDSIMNETYYVNLDGDKMNTPFKLLLDGNGACNNGGCQQNMACLY